MTSKSTREENVQAVFDLKAGYTLGLADVEILKRVARMALAAMDSEPVAYMTYKGYLLHAGDPKLAEYSEPMPLYADPRPASTPAAPVAWDYEWASCITCEGPQNFNRVIEREAPPEWAVDEGQARNIIPLYRHAQPAPETEREPIAWLNDAYLARGVVDGEAGSEDAGPGYIPVYREASPAQTAPVVPDEMTKSLASIAKEYQTTPQNALFIVVGWNACRAAMLQELQKSAGEPNNCRSNENVQVMQDVSRCSTKAAPVLDSLPKTAESRCSKSPMWIGVDWAKGFEPGNSPVIPEWIPVSERMPEKNGTYQVWNGEHVGAVPFLFGSFQCLNPEQVTHWMPTAKPPREVK